MQSFPLVNPVPGLLLTKPADRDSFVRPKYSAISMSNFEQCERPDRVGQGFWVFGIRGRFKSGIRYIAA